MGENMKMCKVCGYTVENNAKECPNCGGFDFEKAESEDVNKRFRRKQGNRKAGN